MFPNSEIRGIFEKNSRQSSYLRRDPLTGGKS
jgi:hypothetical protein